MIALDSDWKGLFASSECDEVQVLNLLNSSLSQVTLPHLVSTSQSIVADFKQTNMQRVAAEWHGEMYFVHRF